jgi:hypothetical protein
VWEFLHESWRLKLIWNVSVVGAFSSNKVSVQVSFLLRLLLLAVLEFCKCLCERWKVLGGSEKKDKSKKKLKWKPK